MARRILVACAAAVTLLGVTAASLRADDAEPMAPEFLTEVRCIGCHGHTARMALRGKTRLGWYITTHRMAAINDAYVSWGERHVIATHLHSLRPASRGFQAVEYAALPTIAGLWVFLRWRARRRAGMSS